MISETTAMCLSFLCVLLVTGRELGKASCVISTDLSEHPRTNVSTLHVSVCRVSRLMTHKSLLVALLIHAALKKTPDDMGDDS